MTELAHLTPTRLTLHLPPLVQSHTGDEVSLVSPLTCHRFCAQHCASFNRCHTFPSSLSILNTLSPNVPPDCSTK